MPAKAGIQSSRRNSEILKLTHYPGFVS
jgi:hypothetical protein